MATGILATQDLIQFLEHELDTPLYFTVKESNSLQYFGDIGIHLAGLSVKSSKRGFGSSLPGYEIVNQKHK